MACSRPAEPLPVGVEDFAPSWIRLDELVNQARFLAASTAVARYQFRPSPDVTAGLADMQRAVYLDNVRQRFSRHWCAADCPPQTLPMRIPVLHRRCHSLLHRQGRCAGAFTGQTKVASASRNHPKDNRLEQALRDCQLTPVGRPTASRAGMLRVVQGSAVWGHYARSDSGSPVRRRTLLEPVMMDTGTPDAVFVQLPDLLHYLHP